MKRGIKALTAVVLATFTLTICSGVAMAAELNRNETVYVKLNHNGSPANVTSVNWVNVQGQNQLSEYTTLKNISVIPSTLKPILDGSLLKIPLGGKQKDVFYSGTTEKQLPMDISIKYFKDGAAIAPEKIGGTSGDIEMRIHLNNTTGQNEQLAYDMFRSNKGSINKTTYVPLMANVAVEMSLDVFSNIDAPDAATVVVGKTMKLNWIKFPYPDEDIVIKAKAQNFELNPITINLIPQMPPLANIDLEPKLTEMYDGVSEMDKKLGLLSDGTAAALKGSSDLGSGIEKFKNGLSQASDGSNQLTAAMPGLSQGIDMLSGGTDKLIMAQNGQIKMVQNIEAANDQLEQAISALAKTPGLEKQAAQLLAGLEKQKAMLGMLEKGGKMPDGTDFPGLTTTKSGLEQAKVGLTQLKTGAGQVGIGMNSLNNGMSELNKNAVLLASGSTQLENGIGKINTGVNEFRSVAVSKLQGGISDQINEVRKAMAEKNRLQQRFDGYTTFTGNEILKDSSTEFLLQTDSIKPTQAVSAAENENSKDSGTSEKNIFEKIADFFKNLF